MRYGYLQTLQAARGDATATRSSTAAATRNPSTEAGSPAGLITPAQRRILVPVHALELRAAEATNPDIAGRVSGYGLTWDETATIDTYWDSFLETFAPDAFDETLTADRDRIVMLSQHSSWDPIGRPDVLRADSRGLYFESDLVATAAGEDMAKLVRTKVIRSVSIGFDPIEWTELVRDGEPDLITITKARLWELSLVTWPAYRSSEVVALRTAAARDPLYRLFLETRSRLGDADVPPDKVSDKPAAAGDQTDRGAENPSDADGITTLDPAERAVLEAILDRRCKGSKANAALVEEAMTKLQTVIADLTAAKEEEAAAEDDGERSISQPADVARRARDLELRLRLKKEIAA